MIISNGMIKNRPTWHRTFLDVAHIISKMSRDPSTQCGCVLVDTNKHIVGCGYNGFVSGIDDSLMPTNRPDKYSYMIHAEVNAVLNSNGSVRGCTAYITHHPCLNCIQYLYQAGVRKVIIDGNNPKPLMLKEQESQINWLLSEVLHDFSITVLL